MRLPDPDRSRAVLIGTSQYGDISGFADVPSVAKNLEELSGFLRKYTGLRDVTVVLNPENPMDFSKALRPAIDEADDVLLVYYSGHGVVTTNNELGLTHRFSELAEPDFSTVGYISVKTAIRQASAKIKIVILDCCHSGKALSGSTLAGDDPDELLKELAIIPDEGSLHGAFVMTATNSGRNLASANGPDGCTAFTGALLDVLRTGFACADEFLTLQRVFQILESRMGSLGHPKPKCTAGDHGGLIALSRNSQYTMSEGVTLASAKPSSIGGVVGLAAQLSHLNTLAGQLDKDWTLGYASDGTNLVMAPVAKHPRASEVSPLGVRFGIALEAADDALINSVRDVLGFGGPGEVVLPSEVIRDFTWFGPDFMAPPGNISELRIGESAGIEKLRDKNVRVVLFDRSGVEIVDREGRIARASSGGDGLSITALFHHSLGITMQVPYAVGSSGQCTIEFDMAGCEPRDVYRGIELRNAVKEAVTIQIYLENQKLCTMGTDSDTGSDDVDPVFTVAADIARDLDRVQDRTGSIFAMPEKISGLERIWLRIIRIILDGGIAAIPRATLNGITHPDGALPSGDLHAAMADFPEGIIELFGRHLRLGAPLRYYHPSATIKPTGKRDKSGSIPFHIASSDGTSFVAFLAGRVTTTTQITPWRLSGIDEPLMPTLPA
ncbi:caspase family protein [Nocardia asiatica]|uniref:caspase family protein n=1 Tax=Nocardia asiatica TaxID=209252 RepID=UPI003EE10CE6